MQEIPAQAFLKVCAGAVSMFTARVVTQLELGYIELLHTHEVRIRPYFPRRSRVKYEQYAPNGCEVMLLSKEGNEVYSDAA